MFSQQTEKPKTRFCFINNLKMCTKGKTPANYEALPYEKPIDEAVQQQIEANRIKLMTLNNLKRQTTATVLPHFHSTRLEHPRSSKITSTVIQHSYCSDLDADPSMSQINEDSTIGSECSSSSPSSSFENDAVDSAMPIHKTLVCIKPHIATVEGDMPLRYTDRVQLLHENNGVLLVRNLLTGSCGYVPAHHLISLEQFLASF